MTALSQDLRMALRSLWRSPGFTTAALLTLTLGVGALGFTLASAWESLATPFDVPSPERVVALTGGTALGWNHESMSAQDYRELSAALKDKATLGISRDRTLHLSTEAETLNIRACLVTPGFFRMLGVKLRMGREFEEEETGRKAPPVVPLSHEAWVRRWGSDPAIVGRSLRFAEGDLQVVGVLEPTKRLPLPFMMDSEVFIPIPAEDGGGWAVGKLRPGVMLQELRMILAQVAPRMGPARGSADTAWQLRTFRILDSIRAREAPEAMLMNAAAFMLLLLGASNLSHLLLAQWLTRHREIAIRASLGGQGLVLFRPLLLEVCLLALGSLALGSVLLFVPVFRTCGWLLEVGTMACSALASMVIVSLLMLLGNRRMNLHGALKEGGQATASRQTLRLRRALVACQMALSCALLGGSLLTLRQVHHLKTMDAGFQRKNTLLGCLTCSFNAGGGFRAQSRAVQEEVRSRISALPGVRAVAFSDSTPFYTQDHSKPVFAENDRQEGASTHAVSPGFFGTFGPALIRGRAFMEQEDACVVSATFASRLWPGEEALGRFLRLGGIKGPRLQVVGIVGEARHFSITQPPIPSVYHPIATQGAGYLTVFVKTDRDPSPFIPILRSSLKAAHPAGQVEHVETLEQLARGQSMEREVFARILMACGGVALLLSLVGQAGTLSFDLALRAREMGIRSALGAGPWQVFREVIHAALSAIVPGLLLGMVAILVLGRALGSFLEGVSGMDPSVQVPVFLVQGLAAFLLALVPALRAARVEPVIVLRSE